MNQLSAQDPRNQDFLMSRAALTENLGEYASAILIRKELAKYDPLNSKNYLELGRNYKLLGDFVEMTKYREIVIKIDGLGAESKIAQEQLIN
jgi:two-component SAPR family response regulator